MASIYNATFSFDTLIKHLNSQYIQLILLEGRAWLYFPLLHDNIMNICGQSREKENEKKKRKKKS